MTGTITKHVQKNGRISWGYYFRAGKDANGKWIQPTKQGFKTKGAAEEALRDAINASKRPESEPPPAPAGTFAELYNDWMSEYAKRRCEPKTIERYEELAAYMLRFIGPMPITDIKPFTIEKALNALRDHGGQKTKKFPEGRPLSPKTIRHIAFLVAGVFKKAVAWERIDRSPVDFQKIALPKLEKRKATIVENDRLSKLLELAETTRLYPLLILADASGCRRGELLALQWPDIDFDTGAMEVTKSLEETKRGLRVKCTKSGDPRRFILPAFALDALREHRAQQDRDKELFGKDYQGNNLVFCRPDGSYYKPDKVSVRVTELARKCGLPPRVGLHALRHTHASGLLSKGVPLPAVSKRLGHANPNITAQIYLHALEADEIAAAKIWNDAMADVITDSRRVAKSGMLGSARAGNKKTA